MNIEDLPDNAKPSQVMPRPSADDIHTRNIRAIADVVRQLRDDMVKEQNKNADLWKTVRQQTQEIEQLKVQLIMMQHQGSGATAS